MTISEVTRRDILDFILAFEEPFHGRLGLIEFLGRVWDLENMPSTDSRFSNAADDIWQHMIRNSDWDERYLLHERLDLINSEDSIFLRFLGQCLHPAVRADPKAVPKLLSAFNGSLVHDGYELVQSSLTSGRPVYSARRVGLMRGAETQHYDFFICHATEDKDTCARPLAEELRRRSYKVWYDEFQLKVGDSLQQSIDKGLSSSRYGVVILSDNFFVKDWPKRELGGLLSKERNGVKVILPVWHHVTRQKIQEYSPLLADRVAANTTDGIERVADALEEALPNRPEVI